MHLYSFVLLILAVGINASYDIPPVDELVLATPANSTMHEWLSAEADAPYWLESIAHQGVAAFNPNLSYKVFRNVKDYGAKGMSWPMF